MGTKTVKDVSPPIPLMLKGDPRVIRVYGAEKDPKVDSLTDMMSILPSSASWLLEKACIPRKLPRLSVCS